ECAPRGAGVEQESCDEALPWDRCSGADCNGRCCTGSGRVGEAPARHPTGLPAEPFSDGVAPSPSPPQPTPGNTSRRRRCMSMRRDRGVLRVVRVLPSCARDWHRSAVLAVGLVFVLRCAAGYGDPVMINEDWWVLFEDHLWGRDLGCLVRPYAGYVSFGPRLLGWAASFLPAGATCFALAWAAGCIGAVALGWLASPRFAILLPDPRARAFVAVTLAMLPVGNAALLCAAMFSHWHMLFALCLMTVARPPETRRGRACELVVGGICAWSHPLALLLAPAFAWRAWTAEATADRRHYAALTLLVLAYAAFGMDGSATMASPGET